MITLNRHPLKFHVVQTITFLFIFSLGIYLSWESAEVMNSLAVKRSHYLVFPIGIALITLAFYTVYPYYANTPIITLNTSEIEFHKQKSFKLSDIDEVKFTGKVPFPMLLSFPMEGTSIHFRNGETKYIYDELYSNSWILKSSLDQLVNDKVAKLETNEIKLATPDITDFEMFKGNPVFSFQGIMLWALLGQ